MWFIVNYVGLFFTVLAMFASSLVLSILFSLIFLPVIYVKNLSLSFVFLYSLYFVGWSYFFHWLDDLGLSFLQLYFTQSSIYYFYPLFSIHPIIVIFLTVLLIFYFTRLFLQANLRGLYIGFGFLVFLNLVFRFYYDGVKWKYLKNFEAILDKEKVTLFLISTNVISSAPDYRKRNEEMTFYKLSVAISTAYSYTKDNQKTFVFLLPEGSLSKDDNHLFNLNQPNLSTSIRNIRNNILSLLGSQKMFSIFRSSFLFYNPTSVDHIEKKLFNSVVMLNLQEVMDLEIKSYQIYNKEFLVPFTERVPEFFRPVSKLLSRWIILYTYLDYTKGKNNSKEFFVKTIRFRPLICFESFKHIYPFDNYEKVEFIVISSNDAWFINNPILDLHLKSAKILSVSKRKPVIFLVNGYRNKIFVFDDVTNHLRSSRNVIEF